ncbi:hypothetical protein VTH06DRAFT_5807 [Thermothelomyces fergusii]
MNGSSAPAPRSPTAPFLWTRPVCDCDCHYYYYYYYQYQDYLCGCPDRTVATTAEGGRRAPRDRFGSLGWLLEERGGRPLRRRADAHGVRGKGGGGAYRMGMGGTLNM